MGRMIKRGLAVKAIPVHIQDNLVLVISQAFVAYLSPNDVGGFRNIYSCNYCEEDPKYNFGFEWLKNV